MLMFGVELAIGGSYEFWLLFVLWIRCKWGSGRDQETLRIDSNKLNSNHRRLYFVIVVRVAYVCWDMNKDTISHSIELMMRLVQLYSSFRNSRASFEPLDDRLLFLQCLGRYNPSRYNANDVFICELIGQEEVEPISLSAAIWVSLLWLVGTSFWACPGDYERS